MKEKLWTYTDKDGKEAIVRERIEKILKGLDKYASIVDVGIQHDPVIRYVCQPLRSIGIV
jgi:hypothetical protein